MIQLYKVRKGQAKKYLLSIKNGYVITREAIGEPLPEEFNKKINIQLFGEEPVALTEAEIKEEKLQSALQEFSNEEKIDNFVEKVVKSIEDKIDSDFDESVKPFEQKLFSVQLKEANDYIADNTADTPTISVIAKTRGITVLQLAKKIIESEKETRLGNAKRVGLKYLAKDKATKIFTQIKEDQQKFLDKKVWPEGTTDEEKADFAELTTIFYQQTALQNFDKLLEDKTAEETAKILMDIINKKLGL